MTVLTTRHSHAFAVRIGTLGRRDERTLHRLTHRHPFTDPAHRHGFDSVLTDPARFYQAERESDRT